MIFPSQHLAFGQNTFKMCNIFDEKFLKRVACLLSPKKYHFIANKNFIISHNRMLFIIKYLLLH